MVVRPDDLAAFIAYLRKSVMLLGNQPDDQCIAFELLDKMDWETGRVDPVAYGRLGLEVSEKPHRGARDDLFLVGKDAAIRSCKRLEKAGVLRKDSSSPLIYVFVFWEGLLAMGNSVQNEETTKSPRSHHGDLLLKQYVTASCDDDETTKSPHISSSSSSSRENPFRMHLQWEPGDSFYQRAAMAMIDKSRIFPGWIAEFKSYRTDNDMRTRTEGQWEHLLLQHVISCLKNPDFFSRGNGGKNGSKSTAGPAAGNVVPIGRRLQVPNFGNAQDLQRWAAQHGLRASTPGEGIEQYRAALRGLCESRFQESQRAGGVGNG